MSNRELLAQIRFEPENMAQCTDAEGFTRILKAKNSRSHVSASYLRKNTTFSGKDCNSDKIEQMVKCLKLALHRSIVSISEPAKQRPLNPDKDFCIKSSMVFSPASRSGTGCCGKGSTTVRRPRFQRKKRFINTQALFWSSEDNHYRNHTFDERTNVSFINHSLQIGNDVILANRPHLEQDNFTDLIPPSVAYNAWSSDNNKNEGRLNNNVDTAVSNIDQNNSHNHLGPVSEKNDTAQVGTSTATPSHVYFNNGFSMQATPYSISHVNSPYFMNNNSNNNTFVDNHIDQANINYRHRRTASSQYSVSSKDDEWGYAHEVTEFTFTDFAPMCYSHIRSFFHIDPKSYCNSLLRSKWHSIPSPGKSCARLFFCGRDWLIKSMKPSESKFLRDILHRYYYHVRDNPYTLLPHIVGHHRLQIGSEVTDFIIMQNVFATTNSIDEKFDLKGSTIGRFALEIEKLQATCTQKDLDINKPIHIQPAQRKFLINQIILDCNFLRRSKIIDYSLLIGIHVLPQPQNLATDHANVPPPRGSVTHMTGSHNNESKIYMDNTAHVVASRDQLCATGQNYNWMYAQAALSLPSTGSTVAKPLDICPATPTHPLEPATHVTSHEIGQPAPMLTEDANVRDAAVRDGAAPQLCDTLDGNFLTACEGGLRSTDVEGLQSEIYYIGIIDILQEYNAVKRLETTFRGMRYDRERISCVNPKKYAARFVAFTSSIIV